MFRRILVIAGLAASYAFGACSSGYIQITDPFLNPDGSIWTGSITYTLGYNTTVAGSTIVGARKNINISSGISLCLAPGLYTPVTLQQSGQRNPINSQWTVPGTGGPYTVYQITGGGGAIGVAGPTGPTGPMGPIGATGSTGNVQFNGGSGLSADTTFSFDSTLKTLSLTGASSVTGGHLIGVDQNLTPSFPRLPGDLLYVGTSGTNGLSMRTILSQVAFNSSADTSHTANGIRAEAGVPTGNTANFTNVSNGGALAGGRFGAIHNGTGLVSWLSGIRSIAVGPGPITDASAVSASVGITGGTITNGYGLLVDGSAGTITNNYGIRIRDLAVGTNRWALLSDGASDQIQVANLANASARPYVTTNSSGLLSAANLPDCGADGQVLFSLSNACTSDSTFTFSSTLKTLSLTGSNPTTGGHLIGAENAASARVAGDLIYLGTTGTDGGPLRGMTAAVLYNPASNTANSSNGLRSFISTPVGNTANFTNASNGGSLAAGRFLATHNGSGTATYISGVRSSITAAGPVTTAAAFSSGVSVSSSVTSANGLLVEASSGAGTITNNYGVHVNALGIGTSRYAFYADTDASYFGGGVQAPLTTPASSSAAGTPGQIVWDANFIYICTATNTWKRATLATF